MNPRAIDGRNVHLRNRVVKERRSCQRATSLITSGHYRCFLVTSPREPRRFSICWIIATPGTNALPASSAGICEVLRQTSYLSGALFPTISRGAAQRDRGLQANRAPVGALLEARSMLGGVAGRGPRRQVDRATGHGPRPAPTDRSCERPYRRGWAQWRYSMSSRSVSSDGIHNTTRRPSVNQGSPVRLPRGWSIGVSPTPGT